MRAQTNTITLPTTLQGNQARHQLFQLKQHAEILRQTQHSHHKGPIQNTSQMKTASPITKDLSNMQQLLMDAKTHNSNSLINQGLVKT